MSMSLSSKKSSNDTISSDTNTLVDDSSVFKVNYVVNGEIDKIYVFHGKTVDSENEEELFKNTFTDAEVDNINAHNIEVVFSEQQIHLDDTIGTIKIKILNELKTSSSIDEIYLYCQKVETLNSVSIYQSLTQNKKLELTQIRLDQFLSNIVSEETGTLFKNHLDKETYGFDDILELKLDNKKYIINKVLGQKFFIVENEYPFVCDPYDVTEYDKFFEKSARKSLSTLNSHLLLNNGKIVNNNIYLCLAKDVLKYIERRGISEETTIKIYYPFLYNKNINSLTDLQDSEETLIEETNKFVNQKTMTSFKTIDMFYDIYKYKKTALNYDSKGIKYVKAIMKPDFDVKIPLEVIFKIVHATENNPFIKYNPSTRQENIYRLYADKTATDGRKIPYMKKAGIFKLMKTIAKTKSVAIYVEKTEGDQLYSVICEFDENGFITLSSEFQTVVSRKEIDEIFRESINPIIQEIKNLLEQSGYKLNKFTSLIDDNVEVKQLTYESNIRITKPFNLEKFRGCISSIFSNESSKVGSDILLRFKRVSNFNKVTSQEAFILEKAEQGFRGAEIIEALLENFPEDLDRNAATDLVRKIANEIQVERGVRKTDIKIKENPGFKTSITLNQTTGIITIVVENINNIHYLETIPIYLDSIVRLTQDKKSTRYPIKDIDNFCSREEQEDVVVNDIISPVESSASSSEVPSLEVGDEEVEYTKYDPSQVDKPRGAFSLFFDDDGDEEEDENEEKYESDGGQGNSSSDYSSSSNDSLPRNLNVKTIATKKYLSSEESDDSLPKNLNVKTVSVKKPFAIPDSSDSEEEEDDEEDDEQSLLPAKELTPLSSIQSAAEEQVSPAKELTPIKSASEEQVSPAKELTSMSSIKSAAEEKVSPIPELIPTPESIPKQKTIKKPPQPPKKIDLIIEDDSEGSDLEDEDSDLDENEDRDQVRNIDKLKLNKPYYFQTLIEKKDPILILKEDTPEFNAYSRTCRSDARRQPVILTDEELTEIKKQHPGFLREEDVIKYGSDKKKQYNYICPRYWCLKTNTIIDANDLKPVIGKDGKPIKNKDGKIELEHPTCGKVLSKKDKKVRPGYYIYEFYGEDENKRYPGYQTDKHPDGFCLPCCFDKYNTKGRITAKQKCTSDVKDNKKVEIKSKKEGPKNEEPKNEEPTNEKTNEKTKENEYIMGPEKFPINPGRWGYLPVNIQKMLHEANADCQISKTNTNVKENHPCLLRHGIEISSKQSFVACISDILFYGKKILSVKAMIERIIDSINIDTFIKYQNGNLVSDFYDSTKKVKIDKYKDSRLFTKIDETKKEDMFFFTKVVSAFENFTNFLRDEDAIIDHRYLWDIISMPNKHLFPKGVNLVILQIPNDDITNNVQLLCPTNHYSNEFYEGRKPTVIIIKEDGYYEPIYSYTVNNKKFSVIKEFKEIDPHLSKTMKAVFKEIIRPFFDTICRPLSSMPTVYKAKRPLLLYDLVQKLDTYDYVILKLVMNFNNKIIGVLAEEPKGTKIKGFVPCYPSGLDDNLKKDIDYVFMTDLSLWNTYDNTIIFLKKLSNRSKKRKIEPDIPCKPAFKIIEDEMVVGILTETNQFIQLSEPIAEVEIIEEYNIPSIKNNNYVINADKKHMVPIEVPIATQEDVDHERVDYIKRIKLETSFYNIFRNTIRILLNDYENAKIREKIENEILKEYIINYEKIKNVDIFLKELVKDKIQFTGDTNYYKLINEVSACIVKDEKSCSNTPNLCVFTENGKCNLILPEKSLITNKRNKEIYFARMADEMVRYSRIKSFMLQPQTYLSFGNIGYNLRDNEIIMIQSLLTQEYFETLVPMTTNKYAKLNSYDEAEPLITQQYQNDVSLLDRAIGKNNNETCEKINKTSISSSIWKSCFPENYKESEYGKLNTCTFNFIIDIIERKTGNKKNINEIKNELYEEYKKYIGKYLYKIIDILIMEGKKTLGDQVKSGSLSFSSFIYTDNYFLTPFDLWLLIVKYEIPTIFISQKFIFQTNHAKHLFVAYGNKDDKFVFILLPGLRVGNIPNFKIIESDRGNTFIDLNDIDESCRNNINAEIQNVMTIETYLEMFVKPKTTNYAKKKPQLLIENEEEIIVKPKKIKEPKLKEPKQKPEKLVKTKVKPNLIIEDESPVVEKDVVNKKQTKKRQVKVQGNNISKKVISKKPKVELLIEEE